MQTDMEEDPRVPIVNESPENSDMGEPSTGRDFLSQYKTITNKFKKRFLRKPNASEASDQYSALTTQLEQEKQLDYAGYCCLSVAKCEQNLGSLPGETAALIRAARLFLQDEQQIKNLGCPSFEESLQAAVGCYGKAVSLEIEMQQPCLAAVLCMELGTALKNFKHTHEAHSQFQRAAQLEAGNPVRCMVALELAASCRIELGDYDGALEIYNKIASVLSLLDTVLIGMYIDFTLRCEVTRVLLLMLLQPTPQKLTTEMASLLEKYAWTDNEDNPKPVSILSEDLFLLLQSVVMACQTRDSSALIKLETDLWPHFCTEQRSLMRILVKVIKQTY